MVPQRNRPLFVAAISLAVSLSCGRNAPVPEDPIAGAPAPGATLHLARHEAGANYYIDIVGPISDPGGKIVKASVSRPLAAAGWAVDEAGKRLASGVDVVVDGIAYAARYGAARPDVAAALKDETYTSCGFEFTLPAGRLAKGSHTLAIRVVAGDAASYVQSPDLQIVLEE